MEPAGAEGFWPGVWRSPLRSGLFAMGASLIIASSLYAATWYAFYDTRSLEAGRRAEEIAQDLSTLVRTGEALEEAGLRRALRDYLQRRRARVTVTRGVWGQGGWTETNGAPVDESRTRVERRFTLEDAPGPPLRVVVEEAVRPPFATALARAWSFSLADRLAEPERWWADALYNRSLPLYGYWAVVLLLGVGTVHSLHRRQLEQDQLLAEAAEVGRELDAAHRSHSAEVEVLRGGLQRREAQRDEALAERQRVADELERMESRADVARAQALEQQLRDGDARVRSFEAEMEEARSELGAAERLLEELDERRDDLERKLKDRNREIRRLRDLVEDARQASRRSLERRPVASVESGASSPLEEQLAAWVRQPESLEVDFSEHSKAAEVRQSFERIDRGFAERWFTHATNPAYERGARRLIRVRPGEGGGELVVVLDDDAGRTLGLRYALRSAAPDAGQVGFVLALLLRAHCREFRDFEVRVR